MRGGAGHEHGHSALGHNRKAAIDGCQLCDTCLIVHDLCTCFLFLSLLVILGMNVCIRKEHKQKEGHLISVH